MGLFDTIYCEYPLPDPRHQELDFQTKSLERLMDTYTITRDGRLVRKASHGLWGAVLDRDVEWPIHGDISIYTSVEKVWIEYVVRFTHGCVEWIRPLEGERPSRTISPPPVGCVGLLEPSGSSEGEAEPRPAKSAGTGESAADGAETGKVPSAEDTLLRNLRRDRRELEKLLETCNDHWGYEDPVYRFYHQSFKVYGLQQQCRSIVDRLQVLAPDRPLHPWFVEIVRAGTGKEFQVSDNNHWTEVTRPILEAFFHARFFLEMAVRYANLDSPPQLLPSGYAALLELFGLR
jgi:hypothetical protein